MDHSYTRTNWEDAPSNKTPMSADNLNNIENGLAGLYSEVEILERAVEQLKTTNKSHVGMIVMSTTLDTMAKVIEIYGGEQWTRITGRFLLGANDTYPINSTGGSANAIVPKHTHSVSYSSEHNGGASTSIPVGGSSGSMTVINGISSSMRSLSTTAEQPSNASDRAGANMPPYRAVYIWERTA